MDMGMEGMPSGMGDPEEGMTEAPVPQGQPGLGGAGRDQTGQQDSGVPTMQANIQNAFTKNYTGTKTMVKQVIDNGHIPDIQDVTSDMGKMWFKSGGDSYVASFNKTGDLMGIETAHFPKSPEDRAINRQKNAIYNPDKLRMVEEAKNVRKRRIQSPLKRKLLLLVLRKSFFSMLLISL